MMKKIRITVDINTCETYITADSFYLTELFYTLLTNSAEALNNVRNPRISVTVYSEGNWFLFEVYDNGAGIDKKNTAQNFQTAGVWEKRKQKLGHRTLLRK